MNEEFDPADTLSELGYSNKKKSGGSAVTIVLTVLLLASIGAAIYMAKRWSDAQSEMLVIDRQLKEASKKLSKLEVTNNELSSLLAAKQAENERLKEEWTAQVETLNTQHKDQLQRTYGQMNEIVYDSRKTLTYIGDIETRLRGGQNIDAEEAKKLASVVNGLAFLYEQYKKPMAEFREVDQYISRQLAEIPASSDLDPKETTPPLKRLFKNKEFKEAQATYNQDKGKKEALVSARSTVRAAYSRAQSQLKALDFDKNKYLIQLDKIVDSNLASAQDLENFFKNSKEILKIHSKIMNIEAPTLPILKP